VDRNEDSTGLPVLRAAHDVDAKHDSTKSPSHSHS
jgi:hypothetical protein